MKSENNNPFYWIALLEIWQNVALKFLFIFYLLILYNSTYYCIYIIPPFYNLHLTIYYIYELYYYYHTNLQYFQFKHEKGGSLSMFVLYKCIMIWKIFLDAFFDARHLKRFLALSNIANIARLRMHVECTHLSHHSDKNETSLQIKVIFGHCCSFETMLFRMLLVELWKYCSNVFSHPGSVWLWGTRITCNRETRYRREFYQKRATNSNMPGRG